MSNLRWSLLIIGGLLLLGIYLYGRWRGQTRPSEIFDDLGHADNDILMGKRGDNSLREKLSDLKDVKNNELFADLGTAPKKDVKIDLRPSDLKDGLKPLSDQPAVKPKILRVSSKDQSGAADVEKQLAADSLAETKKDAASAEKPEAKIDTATSDPSIEKVTEEKPKPVASKSKKTAHKPTTKKRLLVEDEHVVVMHIVAPKGKPFKGKAVLKVFHANGLRYGDMGIFHRITKKQGTIYTVFSVASMVKPGTLNPKEVVDGTYQGLSLFTRLPHKVGSIVAFDEMLHCAQHMATTLKGELRDQKLRPMTHGSIMIQRGNLRKRFPEKK